MSPQWLYNLIFLFSVLFGSIPSLAQERTISGRVTSSEDGNPLPGVNVSLKGTTQGSVTDAEGHYQLVVKDNNQILIFSFVGFSTSKTIIGSREKIDMELELDLSSLEEIVVVGYGTQTKKELTSAVTRIKKKDFNQGNINDPAQLLQGRAPGLSIAKRDGSNPNAPYDIRIRGLATIGPNVDPLIVIDGVLSSSLDQVDPFDIASVDVLKDGAAAAIYGTRGSNGVLIVTTKRGGQGKPTSVNYNGYVSLERVAKTVPVLDAETYGNEAPFYDEGSSTKWIDEITQTGFTNVHTLSLGGSSQYTDYMVSLNYRNIQGIQKGTGWKRLNSRINIKQTSLNEKLVLRANLALSDTKQDLGFNQAFRYAATYNPTAPIRVLPGDNTSNLDPQDFERWGGYYQQIYFDYYNPVALIEQNTNESTTSMLNIHIKGAYEFIPGLIGDISYSQQRLNVLEGAYYGKNSFWIGANRNGLARRESGTNFQQILDATGRYKKDFNALGFQGLLGYSWQEGINQSQGAEGGNFVTDAFSYNNLGAALDFNNGLGSVWSLKSKVTLISFFGRVNFSWNDVYYLMASYRYEGSSMFGENDKWAGFPAISAGAVLSNIWSMSVVDNLKLRLSYGETGNLPQEPYLSISRMGPWATAYINGQFRPAYGLISNPNPDLKWETKKEIDIGIDFAFMNFRLTGTFDWYRRTTSDALFLLEVPVPPNLFGETWLNIGEIRSSGIELSLNWKAVENPSFTYTTGFNLSTYNSTLVSLSSEDENIQFGKQRLINPIGSPGFGGTLLSLVKEGEEIGNLWGPVIGSPVVNVNGDWNILDFNGDGWVSRDDERIIGNGLPDIEIGWSNVFTFGKWDVNAFFRGVFGHDLVNTFRAFYENPNLVSGSGYNVLKSSFRSDLLPLNVSYNAYSSYYVEKASFLKLDNLSIGYNFNLSGTSVRSLRLYTTGQNLLVLTSYSGVDPEARIYDDYANAGVLGPGVDRRNTWYRTILITLGVRLGL